VSDLQKHRIKQQREKVATLHRQITALLMVLESQLPKQKPNLRVVE